MILEERGMLITNSQWIGNCHILGWFFSQEEESWNCRELGLIIRIVSDILSNKRFTKNNRSNFRNRFKERRSMARGTWLAAILFQLWHEWRPLPDGETVALPLNRFLASRVCIQACFVSRVFCAETSEPNGGARRTVCGAWQRGRVFKLALESSSSGAGRGHRPQPAQQPSADASSVCPKPAGQSSQSSQ